MWWWLLRSPEPRFNQECLFCCKLYFVIGTICTLYVPSLKKSTFSVLWLVMERWGKHVFSYPTPPTNFHRSTFLRWDLDTKFCYIVARESYWNYASGVWQLRRDRDDRRRALHPRAVWHGRTGGLRQAAAALLPSNRCLPRVFQCGLAIIIRKCERKVGARNHSPLPEDAVPSRGNTDRSSGRRCNCRKVRWVELEY